jgi:dihydropyrimidinase
MYPRKGALQVGSDADVAVLDPSDTWELAVSDLHETDYSIFEGWKVPVRCVLTLVRGRIVMRDGELVAHKDAGRVVKRTIASDVLTRPCV